MHVGGDGLARGYLNRPEHTAEKFIPNPFSKAGGARMYRTGDVGRYLADGAIEFLGRNDQQIKIRGYRIELGEIEARLQEHEAVREAVVMAREERPGDKRLVAYYTVAEEAEGGVGAEELRTHLSGKLPEYMVPVRIVVMERLPMTANGKIDRAALLEPEGIGKEQERGKKRARSPIEQALAEIWGERLRVEEVGIEDNFFELGGHSLLGTRVMSQIRETFQVEIPLRRLFERPTVRGLAESIEEALREGAGLEIPGIERVSREGRIALSYAQERLWFLDRLEPGLAAYNIQVKVKIRGGLKLWGMEEGIRRVMRKHEVLRTRFEEEEGGGVQVIEREEAVDIVEIDVRGMREEEQEEEVRRISKGEAEKGFDLSRLPLLRVRVIKRGEEEHIAVMTIHHIVCDGWSLGILMREVAEEYERAVRGEEMREEEMKIQYADYGEWQRGWLRGEVLERQMRYWRGQLGDGIAALELPSERPRPAIQTFKGAKHSFTLPEDLTLALRALSRQEGVTMFMTLLAAFKALLHRYTNQENIIVGTPIANRSRAEIEGLIGFFVNNLVLRTGVESNLTFNDLLSRVRETSLAAYAHQDLPFERLVDALALDRDQLQAGGRNQPGRHRAHAAQRADQITHQIAAPRPLSQRRQAALVDVDDLRSSVPLDLDGEQLLPEAPLGRGGSGADVRAVAEVVGVVAGEVAAVDLDLNGRESRADINIRSNDDFTSENGVRSGSGTADDPYEISGWNVFRMYIADTDAHVGACAGPHAEARAPRRRCYNPLM